MLSETIESSRQRAAAAIQDMITKMEKNHKSFINKQAIRAGQYTVEKYCEKESSEIKSNFLFFQSLLLTHLLLYVYTVSRHINNHANQKINKKY